MRTILICNVGNSDLAVPLALLPEALQQQARDRQPISERQRAAAVLEHFEQLLPQIELPLIRKALRHVDEQLGHGPDRIMLFASDQHSVNTSPELYGKDTIITAEVIRRVLVDRYGIPDDQITIWCIADEQSQNNPADYDGVLRSMERQLRELRQADPDARCFLEVTGGTPAMTTSLLIAGTKVLGKHAIPIYITPNNEMAYSLNTGRTLLQHTVLEVLLSDLEIYSYASAAKTFEGHNDLFDFQSSGVQRLILALLHYANQRLNLDLSSCRRSLNGVDGIEGGRFRTIISRLYDEVVRDDALWLLREVYFGTVIKFGRGEYADFIGRIFRFQEGCLRYLVEKGGTQFVDSQGKYFDQAWIDARPKLAKKLTDKGSVRYDVNRVTLAKVADYLADEQGNAEGKAVCDDLRKIDALANLRNRTQIAHGFTGLSRQVLADHFSLTEQQRKGQRHAPPEDAEKIVETLTSIYTAMSGSPPGVNPFDEINQLVQKLFVNETKA